MTAGFPRLNILPDAQRALWPRLSGARASGFVLYGGTAIALRLGHRESIDFDFFSDRPFEADNLKATLPLLTGAEIVQQEPNTLTALVRSPGGTVKISLFGGLRFGRLASPTVTPDGVAEVASLDDLLAHKLKVVLQRVEAKDYRDIDALLASGMSLAAGLGGTAALFPGAPVQEALKALAWFQSASLEELPMDLRARLILQTSRVREIPSVSIVGRPLSETRS